MLGIMLFGRNKTLRVEFIDAASQRTIGFDELKRRAIPSDFEEDTWVEIDGDRWKVVRVEPDTLRRAWRKGLLRVEVNLVEKRTPVEEAPAPVVEEVKLPPVYRNPSRADQLPRMSGRRDDLNLVEIESHAWRDIEFTLSSNRSDIKAVFQKVDELALLSSTQRDGRTFYTRQYDRYELFAPMRGARLTLEAVITEYFPEARAVDGLTFMGQDKVADNTFVFRTASGICFYGQEFEDLMRYFAVIRPDAPRPALLQADAEVLASLMKRKDLVLVDWQQRRIAEATPESLQAFFMDGFSAEAIAEALELERQEAAIAALAAVALEQPVAETPAAQFVAQPIVEPQAQPVLEIAEADAVAEVVEPVTQVAEPKAEIVLEIAEADAVAEVVEPKAEVTAAPAEQKEMPAIDFSQLRLDAEDGPVDGEATK